jgi:MurNAc alpha-1-phosphate uridylyltransferase
VVNVHYLPHLVRAHLARRRRPEILISDETGKLLDTGGGIANALPFLGDGPFYLLNSDSFWIEGARPNLRWLAGSWNDAAMDVLLLLAPTVRAVGYRGRGDFRMDPAGRLFRRPEREVVPFVYAGAAILHPRLFAGCPDGPFSLNLLFDRAIEAERLNGVRMDGLWLHVGTPEAIGEAEMSIADSAA